MAFPEKRKNYPSQSVRDGGGNLVDFQITDGEPTPIDPSTAGYSPTKDGSHKGFYICPLTEGDIIVRLVGQMSNESFTIPSIRIEASIGLWLEEKVAEIIQTGTTVTSCLIGWSN